MTGIPRSTARNDGVREPFRERSAYRHWTPVSTRWHDNDVYGHVNNSVYYSWFDTAVNAWLIEVGLLNVEGGDPIALVVETGCRYAVPLAFPAPVEIGLAVARLGSSSVTYHLGVFAQRTAKAAAEGHFTHVIVGRESRRPVSLPAEWRTHMERLV